MVIEMFLDEPGEPRCSNLEVPLLTSESLKGVVMLHLEHITEKQWALLAEGTADLDTAMLLCDLCLDIVERVYNLIREVVAPQVYAWTSGQSLESRASDHSNASVTMNGIESPHREQNFHTLTEEDVQASLGDSLHQSLGEALDVAAERSDNSDELLLLVAQEVTKKVNRHLADGTQPTGSRQPEESSESATTDMVYHVAKILERCLMQNFAFDSADGFSQEDTEEGFSMEASEGSLTERQSCKPTVCLTSVIPFSCEKEFSRGEETFLAVFLSELLDHIAHATETSVLDLDFDRAFKNLRRALRGTGFTPPQTVGNLHCTVFTKLRREFGSAELLRVAAVSGGTAFGEAVARELKGQLQKPLQKSFVDRVRRYFRRRSSKQAAACEVVRRLQKRPRRRCPAVIGMFSDVVQVLRKSFTCNCGGSQDD